MISKVIKEYRSSGFTGVCAAIYNRGRGLLGDKSRVRPLDLALKEVLRTSPFTIVQIGAFIGDTENDPLFEHIREQLQRNKGRLVLIEPVPEFFARLKQNYAGIPNIIFENAAVSDKSGPAKFYRIGVDPRSHGQPAWLSQLGSLKPERMGALWDAYEQDAELKAFCLRHQIEETVECIRFPDLLRKHAIGAIDLLTMDVEGSELEILQTIPFDRCGIRFLNYESVLLNENKTVAEEIVGSHGYRHIDFAQDTFCYTSADAQLFC